MRTKVCPYCSPSPAYITKKSMDAARNLWHLKAMTCEASTRSPIQSPLLGAHFSIAGGLHHAILTASRYRCTALQIFTKNASTWKERYLRPPEIDAFLLEIKRAGLRHIFSHGSYLINLASPDTRKWNQSQQALAAELERSAKLGIPHVIIHPGAHMGTGEKNGLARIATAVKRVFDGLPQYSGRLLLETTAGQGTNLGASFDQLAHLYEMIGMQERIGFCLDTCHVFAAGYDLRTESAYEKLIQQIDATIRIDRLFAIHLNDGKKDLGARIDRHEHIGKGTIGKKAFQLIMNDSRLGRIPKIIETPKPRGDIDYDRINLRLLRSLVRPCKTKRT